LALLKLVMHARSGGTLEIMGMLLGKIDGENMIVMDSFALPVEGTGILRIDSLPSSEIKNS
jgi:COP9 signalosome complex subunit 5